VGKDPSKSVTNQVILKAYASSSDHPNYFYKSPLNIDKTLGDKTLGFQQRMN